MMAKGGLAASGAKRLRLFVRFPNEEGGEAEPRRPLRCEVYGKAEPYRTERGKAAILLRFFIKPGLFVSLIQQLYWMADL